jgi:hypothetical protein
MDLIDLYLQHERDHVSLLLAEVERREATGRLDATSNLFNFRIDFDRQQVTIEEDGPYFHDRDEDREMVVGLPEFVSRLSR